jgi:valyl-tRNA synthetase
VKDCTKGYENFNFFIPSNKIREFAWNMFAAHYLELVKARAYGEKFSKSEQQSAWFTLHACLKTILLLLAPITPFISDSLWRTLYSKKSIHIEQFPKPEWETKLTKKTQKILEFNTRVWDTKKKMGVSLKDQIEINIPVELEEFKKDLIAMHNIKK